MRLQNFAPRLFSSYRKLQKKSCDGVSVGRGLHGSTRPVQNAVTSHLLSLQRLPGSESCSGVHENEIVRVPRPSRDFEYDRLPRVSAVKVCRNGRGGTPVSWVNSRFYSSTANSRGPVPVDPSTLLDEEYFHDLADDVLHNLQEKIEILGEDLNVDGFDCDYADGVLTVRLGSLGTYVINKQTPNRQIWLSSPVSGPGRFDWVASRKVWVYRRTQDELVLLLEKELSQLLGTSIQLS
ncbi:frataxin [Marchantia polymorpha subsp. ruderalis]|uniref:ferroxidase n=2 Tax=Marchantia polymorpha TaxID=3197 RepID=A0A176VGH6_MARPO|nr:hypothetical protein AXG93_411s1030 [Marchantia polymorpha subsp. ruderalis]PTQ47195.1 hypothetical protein MARPO_0009s0241 [Marchantia polymorpha]BBN17588.1 hypothetical protein Mp_7g15560 [Marchantia polymorpha subsp. ruderalis]|eukprot:PTQ47195.1 hypothetical protein MARPO_0009s0241 [Marchantia polymorpha]